MIAILIVVIVAVSLQDPFVVIWEEGGKKTYALARRKADSITESDIQSFMLAFLRQLLEWEKLDTDAILHQVSPLVTQGLLERLKQELTQKTEKEFRGKLLSQAITNVKIIVTEKDVIATFDKVIRIDGIPLVVSSEIAFNLIRGSQSRWNPMGLYVNGMIEREGQKN